jgi:hypothetical protein
MQMLLQVHWFTMSAKSTVDAWGTAMHEPRNGMSAADLQGVTWRKSRHSNSQGTCVELAGLPSGEVAVRNSRHPDSPALIYTRAEVDAFIRGAKDGEFDDLLS